jgi:hypothetical protein
MIYRGRWAVWPRNWPLYGPAAGLGGGLWPAGSDPASPAGCSRPSSRCSPTGRSRCGPRASTRPLRHWWASRCRGPRSRACSPRTLRAARGSWSGWHGGAMRWPRARRQGLALLDGVKPAVLSTTPTAEQPTLSQEGGARRTPAIPYRAPAQPGQPGSRHARAHRVADQHRAIGAVDATKLLRSDRPLIADPPAWWRDRRVS